MSNEMRLPLLPSAERRSLALYLCGVVVRPRTTEYKSWRCRPHAHGTVVGSTMFSFGHRQQPSDDHTANEKPIRSNASPRVLPPLPQKKLQEEHQLPPPPPSLHRVRPEHAVPRGRNQYHARGRGRGGYPRGRRGMAEKHNAALVLVYACASKLLISSLERPYPCHGLRRDFSACLL